MRILFFCMCLIFVAGCANKKYCEREQDYHGVKQGSYLRAPEGLEVPKQDPSYDIPRISNGAQAAALSEGRECLEIPPTLRSDKADGGRAE